MRCYYCLIELPDTEIRSRKTPWNDVRTCPECFVMDDERLQHVRTRLTMEKRMKCVYYDCEKKMDYSCGNCSLHCNCQGKADHKDYTCPNKEISDKEKFNFLYGKISAMEKEIEKLKTVQVKLLDKFDQQIIQSGAN